MKNEKIEEVASQENSKTSYTSEPKLPHEEKSDAPLPKDIEEIEDLREEARERYNRFLGCGG